VVKRNEFLAYFWVKKYKTMIRVVLFEDNTSLRNTLSMVLSHTEGINFTGAFADANEAIARIRSHQPDIVLMDIQMPGISGIDALNNIKAQFPDVKVLMQTVFEDDNRIFASICAGANGYVLKNPDPNFLINAIFDVQKGGSILSPSIAAKVLYMFQHQFVKSNIEHINLTEKETEVLGYMVKGQSYKMIADSCGVSFNTVHWHVKNIYEKLHVNSAPEAVAKAIENRLV
jgi:DNA-binding NarL/FixJ family response regulator